MGILNNICEQSLLEGQQIDLKDCCYGAPHWDGHFVDKPSPYYFFLAGFVRTQRLTHIFEVGTHYGGSIMSMSRGLYNKDIEKSRLVTVDVTYKNEESFRKFAHIKRIQGDALSKKVVKKVVECFDRDIDLIFIDSVHNYEHVKLCIAIYANRLKPKYIILDDIFLNESMRRLWRQLKKEFGENTLDVSHISGRTERVGLGIIDWGHTFKRNWRHEEFKLKFLNAKIIYRHLKHMIKFIIARR